MLNIIVQGRQITVCFSIKTNWNIFSLEISINIWLGGVGGQFAELKYFTNSPRQAFTAVFEGKLSVV